MLFRSNVAQRRGYIKGIIGRRHRFIHWEAAKYEQRGEVSTDEVAMREKYGRIVRAYTQNGLNRLAQDGEGSHVKKALGDCHAAGIFDALGFPLNIVHDDVSLSNAGGKEQEEALQEAKEIMEKAIEWKVPMRVERSDGENWGAV